MSIRLGIGDQLSFRRRGGVTPYIIPAPFSDDMLFFLNGEIIEDGGSYYYEDKTGNDRHFLITGLDWTTDSRVSGIFPFKTFATISAPAGDATLIAADVDNFLYDAGGTPNQITPQMMFQNVDYKNKLFCRFVDHTLDVNNKEIVYSGIKDFTLYDTVKAGVDLTTCNTYFGVPVKIVAAVKWVGKDGNDGAPGDGTEAHPYLTIMYAVAQIAAATPSTIYIKTGDYNEAFSADNRMRFIYLNKIINFIGIGFVKITTDHAVNIIYTEGTGTYNFTRMTLYGTKTYPIQCTMAIDSEFSYIDVICTGYTSIVSSRIKLFYRSKIANKYSIIPYQNTCTFNECYLKGEALQMTNNDTVGKKSIITYCKVVNSGAVRSCYVIGTYLDYLYNVSYISGAGNELSIVAGTGTRGDVNIKYNEHNQNFAGVLIYNQNNAKIHNLDISHNRIISSTGGQYQMALYCQHFVFEYNYASSNGGLNVCSPYPEAGVACSISIKYNSLFTKSVANDAIINFTEAGIANVFDGAEIMYNIIKGGVVDFPLLTMTCHGILARNGKNMKIAYNWIEGFPIGIVYKTEGVASTSGGIYGNVLINNRVSIYLRANNEGRVYGNVMYQTNSAANTNSYLVTADTQGPNVCTNCYFENNIMYRNNSPVATPLFSIQATSLAAGTKIKNNIVYSPDTDAAYWLYDLATNYTLAQSIANGYAENINVVDPVITAIRPYPIPAIEGATDLGADFDDGLDVSSVWAEAVVLKAQGANWQYGAFIQ